MHRYQREHKALGSTVLLTIVTAEDAAYAAGVLDLVVAHITAFEQQFSRFREDSELTAFNRKAGKHTPITPAMHQLLTAVKTYAERTHGLYNPFILPALQRAGYRSSWPSPQDSTAIDYTERHLTGIRDLQLGNDWAHIPADTALDFGGIGKGYLLDELAGILVSKSVAGYWLSLGGDIVCAGRDIDGQSWKIGVQDASEPSKTVHTIAATPNARTAIATSGVTKRKGEHRGTPWHHLIDPRTGKPADTTILTATVVGPSGTDADIYAKAIAIGGEVLAKRWIQAGQIRLCILQTVDGTRTIEGDA